MNDIMRACIPTATIVSSTIVSLVVLIWMFRTIHSGNGFHEETVTKDGTVKKRLDWDLIGSVILGALALFVNVLFIGDFLCLIITEEWAFDPKFTKGSLVLVLIVFSIYVAKKVYNYTLDKAERQIQFQEVKVEEKE